jgi:hypothetical protein
MSARPAFAALVVAGAIAAVALGFWLALRDGEKPPQKRNVEDEAATAHGVAGTPTGGGENVGGTAGDAPGVRRAVPSLPGGVKPEAMDTTGVGEEPLWTSYDDEQRDPAWATEQERLIRNKLKALLTSANSARPGSVEVPQVECREVHCRMLVTGTDKQAFTAFVESLQDERGFYGDAALLALDGYGETVDKRTGNKVQLVRVHLKFNR